MSSLADWTLRQCNGQSLWQEYKQHYDKNMDKSGAPCFCNWCRRGPTIYNIYPHKRTLWRGKMLRQNAEKHHYNFTVVNQRRFTPQHSSNNHQIVNKRSIMTTWQGDTILNMTGIWQIWRRHDNMIWQGLRIWQGCHLSMWCQFPVAETVHRQPHPSAC